MAKRFEKTAINWAELAKRVPPEQKTEFIAFKAKSDAYFRRVQSYPREPPKIDWEKYDKAVPVKGLVEKLRKEYENFKVPYPKDPLSASVDEQWKTLQTAIKAFCDEQNKEIEKAKKELARINALPKFEDMTLEMFAQVYPKDAVDFVGRPSFWPHVPEEQPNYKPQKGKH